jgi:hypothetical protein
MKTLGNNPSLFSETVAPTLDLNAHYNAPLVRVAFDTLAAQSPSAAGLVTLGLTLPGGFIYWLYGASGFFNVGAAAAITWMNARLQLATADLAGGPIRNHVLGAEHFTFPVAPPDNANFGFGWNYPQPLLLASGAQLRASVVSNSVAVATHTISVNALVAAIPL